MSKWIDADAFLKEYCEPYPHIYKAMSRAMAEAPSIDIVRCGECSKRKKNKFCLEHMRYEEDNDGFCSYGEREGE